MTRLIVTLLAALASTPVVADTLVAARTIRAQAVLTADDFKIVPGATPGAVSSAAEALGKETRVVLYAGRPIRLDQIGLPALVERNALVSLVYATPVMRISTEGRALGRAGLGETIRVLNISSRTTVFATVTGPGEATVKAP
ncbi:MULTISPECIES: flagellar basal body P-ring formation chaperone FlgA [unclassified Dinoroseobacter]|uniref:flagellar basal body P-ring formation chaperone FlgA n=1 Tax=unclassified Dinoroseobacter TaxID=2620028 RepID=UPI003C7DAA9D